MRCRPTHRLQTRLSWHSRRVAMFRRRSRNSLIVQPETSREPHGFHLSNTKSIGSSWQLHKRSWFLTSNSLSRPRTLHADPPSNCSFSSGTHRKLIKPLYRKNTSNLYKPIWPQHNPGPLHSKGEHEFLYFWPFVYKLTIQRLGV